MCDVTVLVKPVMLLNPLCFMSIYVASYTLEPIMHSSYGSNDQCELVYFLESICQLCEIMIEKQWYL